MTSASEQPLSGEPDLAAAKPRGRRWLGLAVRIAVTVAFLGIVIHRTSQAELLAMVGWHLAPAVVTGLLLIAATLVVNAVRWTLVARGIGAPVPYGVAIELTFIGHFFSQMLPTSVGGDVYRAWGARKQGMTLTQAVFGVLLERFIGLATLTVLVVVGMPLLGARIGSAVPTLVATVMAAGLVAGLVVLVNMRRFSFLFGRFAIWQSVLMVSAAAMQLVRQPLRLLGILAVSLAVNFGSLSLVWCLARYFGVELSLIDAVIIIPGVTFLANLPISIGGWGVREAGLAGGFSLLGLPIEAAVATSIMVGLLSLLAGIPGFVPFLMRQRYVPGD
jgi:uncharacterized membrane protein YbhN (UPF0104 family)